MIQQKKSKIPYLFFIFFGVIFSVDFFFIYISQKTWRGVVTENAYQKGLKYNQTLAEEKKQQELGWKMSISFKNFSQNLGQNSSQNSSQNSEQNKGILLINLQNKNLQPITDAEILVELRRPTQEGYDFSQKMEFIGGLYESKINFPLKGQWDFLIKAKKGDDIFQETKRFIIR